MLGVTGPAWLRSSLGNVNMRVEGHNQTWNVDSEEALETALLTRDARGGAEFWLSSADKTHPCLAVQIGVTSGSVTFFPKDVGSGQSVGSARSLREQSSPNRRGPAAIRG